MPPFETENQIHGFGKELTHGTEETAKTAWEDAANIEKVNVTQSIPAATKTTLWLTEGHLDTVGGYAHDYIWIGDTLCCGQS